MKTTLLALMDTHLLTAGERQIATLLFLELSVAFSAANHEILLSHLKEMAGVLR